VMDTAAALAMAGATTLVGAMATDAWQWARSAFGRLLGQGDEQTREVAQRRLDRASAEVEAAGLADRDGVRARLAGAWQVRLADMLEERPEVGVELEQVIDDLRRRLPPAQQTWIQHVTASGQGAVAQGVMFGDIVNHEPPGRPGAGTEPT